MINKEQLLARLDEKKRIDKAREERRLELFGDDFLRLFRDYLLLGANLQMLASAGNHPLLFDTRCKEHDIPTIYQYLREETNADRQRARNRAAEIAMSNEPEKQDLHEYAGGWITERKGSKTPGFLKLAYPIIIVAVIAYTIIYMNGEIHNESRGALVRSFNAVTGTADSFMYIVVGLIAIFAVILIAFTLGKDKH